MRLKIVFCLFVLIALFGCTAQNASDKQPSIQTITISGSGSGISLLKLIQSSFEENYPNVQLTFLPSTSTGDGISGVLAGDLDIGASARKMKESEKSEHSDLLEFTYAIDAMVLAVNPSVEAIGLTSEQIKKIFTGEIKDWSEVGGQKAQIILLDREEEESTKIILREHILGNITITPDAKIMYSSKSMLDAIQKVPNSIGQTSLAEIKSNSLDIKPLSIDGIKPSQESVISGEYKLIRSYGVIVSKIKYSGVHKNFIDYVYSKKAQDVFYDSNLIAANR